MPFTNGGVSFSGDGAMLVNPNTPDNIYTNNMFPSDEVGMVWVNYTDSPASTAPRRGGLAYSATTGALFCTTDAVGATTVVRGGLARSATGQLHITFVEPDPKFVRGGVTVDEDGVVYAAGPIETQAAWFRFKLGITSASNAVSQWDDQSGNSRNLLQATGTNQPALQTDRSILFDGVDNFMKCDAFTFNQPETVYILCKQITWTLGGTFVDGNTAGSSIQISQRVGSPTLQIYAGLFVADNSDLAINTYGALAAVFNGASSSLQVNNNTATTGNVGAENPGGFTLGANSADGNFSNIQVKEALLYAAAHDATQRARVISYLSAIGDLGL